MPGRSSESNISELPSMPSPKPGVTSKRTPLRFLMVTAISVFVAEAFIMVVLESIEPMGFWTTVFLDASLILVCTLPALYFWSYRPLIRHSSQIDEALENVRESERKLSFHLQNTPVAAIEWNLDWKVTEWNAAAQKVFGFTREEALGKRAPDLIIPKSTNKSVREVWDKLLDNTGGYHSVNENLTKDGRVIICDWYNTPLIDNTGQVCGVASLGQDITDRLKAEDKLRDSERRSRAWLENSPVCTKVLDSDFNLQFMSAAGVDGLKIEDVTQLYGKPYPFSFYPESFRQIMTKNLEQAKITGEVIVQEASVVDVEGNELWFHSTIVPVNDDEGRFDYMMVLSMESTERKLAEQALRESEERFEAMSGSAQDAIIMMDPDGNVSYWNDAARKVFGWSTEEIVGRNLHDILVPQEYHSDHKKGFDKFYQTGEGAAVGKITELTAYRKDGSIFPVELSMSAVKLKGEWNAIAIVRDITERKQSEEKLQESEEKYRGLVETSQDLVWKCDSQGRFTYLNPAWEKTHGYKLDEMLGRPFTDFQTPEMAARDAVELGRHIAGGSVIGYESSQIAKSGKVVHLVFNAIPLYDANGEVVGTQGTAHDITETKRLQELESRAERLETAGTIAGQVAHDFNNLLAPLMAYPELIREELGEDHPVLSYLAQIENSANQIAEINQQLLTLGRRGHYNTETLDLNKIIGQALKEIETLFDDLTIKTDFAEDLMPIRGGGAQIHRVLNNLLHNANDAIQGTGTITVKTENYYVDDVSVIYGRVPKGEYVKVTLADSGCGIPDDIVQKIFDPFVTSKTTDKKRGSGLGLSVVDAVVKDHGGYLDLHTEIGVGTSFYLYFPVTRQTNEKQVSEEIPTGTESIMIVDDDDTQRLVTSQILERLGYKVTLAESGERAVELLKESPQDLLVLDMIMPPGIDGTETYQRALVVMPHQKAIIVSGFSSSDRVLEAQKLGAGAFEVMPHQKAIIVSGFSSSDRVLEAQKLGAGAFVRKPLTKRSIAAAVRFELDKQIEYAATK